VADIPLACHAIFDADRSKEQEEGDAMSAEFGRKCQLCDKMEESQSLRNQVNVANPAPRRVSAKKAWKRRGKRGRK
jgi:hypothetical protein